MKAFVLILFICSTVKILLFIIKNQNGEREKKNAVHGLKLKNF